jgi:hypothetical protein
MAKLDDVIDTAATRIIAGGPLSAKSATKIMPTKADTVRLQRVLGVSIEEFNQRLGEKLAVLSDKIASRIEEKIDDNEFKAGELGFIFSVTEDKRRALDARAQLGSAQVNIQVNNYGDKTREEIMADLQAPTNPKLDEPLAKPVDPESIDPESIKPEDVI